MPHPFHLVRRLRQMSGHELYTRGAQEFGKRSDVLLHRLGIDASRPSDSGLDARGPFFIDSADVPRIVETLRRRMPEEAAAIVARGEKLLQHRFDLLGYTDLDFGRDIDWQLDPVSGKRAPNAPWPAIPFLDYAITGDHKVIWELNRHQFLVTLAEAYRLTGDRRFSDELQALWYDWLRKNPYPLGINWASSLEVAFRAISWMWVAFLLEETEADSAAFQRDLAREIARAGWYIRRFLSTYFSPNTHLLGEGVALFLIGVRYPGLRAAAGWREVGWRTTLEESKRQVRADGLHFEQSTYYHVYALDFLLHARLLAARAGSAVPAELDTTLRRMISALAALSQAGPLPRFGDDDGGRLFDGSRNRPAQMLDPLSTGAVLFQDPWVKAAAPSLTEETLWLLGPSSETAFDSLAAQPPGLHSVALPESGVCAMASTGPAQLFLDAGTIGPYSAGHGHADALGIQLSAAGRAWLIDPGTCRYMGADGERKRFRSTPAHNTLTVDGLSQADPHGPFSWGILPRVELRRWCSGPSLDLFEGVHTGYERLPHPLVHRRWVVGLRCGLWLVRDVVESNGPHELDFYWRFAPDLAVSIEGDIVTARGGDTVLAIVPKRGWTPTLEVGDDSPAYGVIRPAPVARWNARTTGDAEFAVVVGFDENAEGVLEVVDSASYQFDVRGTRHRFAFATQPGRWSDAGWSTDAAMLYTRAGSDGNLVVLADGSYLEDDGRTLLDSAQAAPYWEKRW